MPYQLVVATMPDAGAPALAFKNGEPVFEARPDANAQDDERHLLDEY